MPISELEEFVQIANKMNFSKAAESLFLSQSTLSKKVGRLEERLGFKLFDRDTRSVELTAAGASFYRDAIEIIDKYNQAVAKALEVSRDNRPVVQIGGNLGNLRMFTLIESLRAYSETFGLPFDVKVNHANPGVAVTKASANEALDDALQGINDIDILYVSNEVLDSRLEVVPLYRDPIVFYASENRGFTENQEVCLADLKDYYFVTPTTWRVLVNRVDQICAEAGFTPKRRLRFIEYMGDMVGKGSGEEIIPITESMSTLMAPRRISGLVKLTCRDPQAYAEVAAVYLPEKLNPHVEKCLQILHEAAAE